MSVKLRKLGRVTLVGAGPGPADLLTLGALKALEQADLVLYDALVSREVLDLIPRRAKPVYTGKRCGKHSLTQAQINALLVSYAQKGLHVVRLKGGDPFIFGRGSEEIAALRAEGIPYHVIPGVSALNGVAAQATLPLTARTHANEFRAIQGHRLPSDEAYWLDLAHYQGTVVIFMGSEKWPNIAAQLLKSGAPANLPFAIIKTGIHGEQIVTRGVLSEVSPTVARLVDGPAIIYLGPNVQLMDDALPCGQVSAPLPLALEETADVVAFTHFS